MPLIASISGIRGTIGDDNNENLSPANIRKFVIAYCKWIFSINNKSNKLTIVTGRDGRESGPEIHKLVNETIISRSKKIEQVKQVKANIESLKGEPRGTGFSEVNHISELEKIFEDGLNEAVTAISHPLQGSQRLMRVVAEAAAANPKLIRLEE